MLHSRSPKAFPRFLVVALALLFAVSPLVLSVAAQSPQSGSSHGSTPNFPTQQGCYVQSSRGGKWQTTTCAKAPNAPQDVGNGNDESASSASTIIGSSVGSFGPISGLTSEVGGTGPAFPGSTCLSGNGVANCYSLQLNTETFSCNTTYTGGVNANCWEQFVSSNTGVLYIQYWLLNYCSSSGGTNCNTKTPSFSCPSTNPPGGGWWQSGNSCYGNGNAVNPPTTAATSLGKLSLYGYANYAGSGNDVIQLCISGGSCYSVTFTDSVLNLYQNWKDSEFNVFGDASGSQAVFNVGTTITVLNTITDQSGSAIRPSCANTGYTGETNNLFLGPCIARASGITFTEASQTYTLSGTPSDATILAGQTATYSVGVTLTAGSAAPVALSVVSGLPSGAVATFSPSSVTPTASSTLNITTSSSVALGNFALVVQGQYGVLVENTTVNLHIYDFTMSVTPSDQTVLRGDSASYIVTLTLDSASSAPALISLSVSGLPSGSTSSFSPSSELPTFGGSTSTLLVTTYTGAPGPTALGNFSLTVTGSDLTNGGSRSVSSVGLHLYDFSISVSPSDQTVLRGGYTYYTVTLTLAAGSSPPPSITLGVSGLPTGSTSAFSPASIQPTLAGATSNLTVSTYTGAPGPTALGDYALSVTGSDLTNGGARTASSVDLHIYDFTLTTVPTSLLVLTTGSNDYSVSVTLDPGSSIIGLPTIDLSVTGLPTGASGVFTPSSGTLSFNSTLVITTSNTPSGTYSLAITGTDSRSPEGGTRTASPTLVVLTPAQALQLIINQVKAFKSAGILTSGQANSLISKLNHAIINLNMNQDPPACQQLSSFVNQVLSLEAEGVLTPAEANMLLGGPLGVYAIMAAIPC